MHSAGFSPEQDQRLQKWLLEAGEIYVRIVSPFRSFQNVAPPQLGVFFLVRSILDLQELIVTELDLHIANRCDRPLSVRAFGRLQYAVRGVADDRFLQEVLQKVPEGEHCLIISLEHYYPPFPRVV